MTELDLFTGSYNFNGNPVRTTVIDGEGWLVFADACAALGHTNPSKAAKDMVDPDDTRRLRRSDTLTWPEGMAPQVQEVLVVNESGLYDLVFHSRVPSARRFKQWVKSILRELRENGVVDTRQKPISELEMARRYVAALERNAELEPKAQSWDTLAEAAGDYSLREAAQILDRDPSIATGQNRLAKYLRQIGWCDSRGTPYQSQVDLDRLRVRSRSYDHPLTGELQATTQLRITVKGLHELHKRMGGTTELRPIAS